ncbi:ABC transporter ATP-binding protein [Sporomusa termitida]|uniref:Fe(3+) dicitrate transport ATP-binding protein FecE n=1 Tax=Sporomusa termitida TaxID=2377 RepID=A0A517DQ24_9FIRM|nr:ABC transporter ATP-binding protein [Sporomusa termitida]QDR79461.1 Fe(3+) dicitrate transport ATP-binding protein FecE [Sporomusa termitida]
MRLDVHEATFSYDGSRHIFADISFSVQERNIMCLLGPNGAGKSTLMKCLNNLMPLSKGCIQIDGQDIRSLSRQELTRKIAYVPQSHIPTFPFVALDVVLMGRAPHLNFLAVPGKKDIEIAKQAMNSLGIYHLRDKRYTEISGGERQLVLLAAVIAQQTSILLLDEPTSHLDFGNQIRLLKIINSLAEQGMLVIMSTHFPDHAFLTANTVAIIAGGKIAKQGSPAEVITEENIYQTYGIKVIVGQVNCDKSLITCVPLIR